MGQRYGGEADYYRGKVQTYDPVGYPVVAGSVNVAAARDLVLEQRPSSIRTSGAGGDILIAVGRDIAAHDAVAKTVVTDIVTDGRASIDAGGAIHNLTVAAHDLAVRAGDDIAGGIYQATGQGIVTSGGSIVAGSEVKTYSDDFFTGDPQAPYADCSITNARCHRDRDPTDVLRGYPLHTFFDAGAAGTLLGAPARRTGNPLRCAGAAVFGARSGRTGRKRCIFRPGTARGTGQLRARASGPCPAGKRKRTARISARSARILGRAGHRL
jgi:hypothetical protein